MTLSKVLILARDEMVAALLGLMVELRGFSPTFVGSQDSPEAALRRDAYHAVVIDCDHPDCNDDLVEIIRASSAQPILFSPLGQKSELRQFAARHGARSFILPTDPETFARILTS